MIDRSDLTGWLNLPVTKEIFVLLIKYFDSHEYLLGAEQGQSLDRLKGRAEVLDFIIHKTRFYDLIKTL